MHIVLANGRWKRIEDIEIGEEILSWDGNRIVADRVKAKWCAGPKMVTKYRGAGFPEIATTADHRFYAFSPQWCRSGWLDIGALVRRRLAVGVYERCLPGKIDAAGELAELIGYLITDGYVCHGQQPKFTNVNVALVDRVADLACRLFNVVAIVRKKGRGYDVGLSNGTRGGGEIVNPIKEWFRAGGALSQKAARSLPSQIWEWSDAALWKFFGAVIDGDGSIYSQKKGRIITDRARGPRQIGPAAQVTIHAGMSRSLAEGYQQLLRKIGIVAGIEKESRGENWKVRLTRQDSIRKLLSGITTIGKEKGRLEALALCSDRRERQARYGCEKAMLAPIGAPKLAETWDIETETHGCFFANGYLVHNSGKDDLALNWAAVAAHERPAEYWHMLPEAAQGRKVIWDAVNPHTGLRRIDQAFPRILREKTREDEMAIKFKSGSLWRVVGSDNYQSLLGATPAGVVFSEWALADPQAWAFLRPILTENGGWTAFITTPRGTNHAAGTLKLARSEDGWFGEVLKATDTGVFSAAQLAQELKEYQAEYGIEEGKALFEQEYECSFESPLIGSYYGPYLTRAQNEGRIVKNIPIDRGALVHTTWDLGRSDSTAIWFLQRVGAQVRLIDYHDASGLDMPDYAAVLDEKRIKYKWVYGRHYFPHDMRQQHWGNGGPSREQTARNLGYEPSIVDQHHDMDGVNAVRRLIDVAIIDGTRCERGLNALRNFRRQWDEKRKVFHDKYLHDWASHGAKALETYAVGHRDPKAKPAKVPVAPPLPSFAAMPHERGTGWMGRR